MSIDLVASEIERKSAKIIARQQATEREVLRLLGSFRVKSPEFYSYLILTIRAAEVDLTTEQEILKCLGSLRDKKPEFFRYVVSMIKAAELNL